MNLPKEYTEKMKKLLGNEYDSYIESFSQPRYYGLRANTLKVTPDELTFNWLIGSWNKCHGVKGIFTIDGENVRPAKRPYYNAGLYYIQEPSAMSTGAMLNVEPGDRVLDLCAAPGGKSTQVAAKLKGQGIIVSNDISASRCKALLKNIEVSGVPNCVITNEMPENLAKKFPKVF